jgi:hypothetical protein
LVSVVVADCDRAATLSQISAEKANKAAIRTIVIGKSHLTSGLILAIRLESFFKRMFHLPRSLLSSAFEVGLEIVPGIPLVMTGDADPFRRVAKSGWLLREEVGLVQIREDLSKMCGTKFSY